VAAPVFRNIASELVKHMGIRPGQNDGRLAAKGNDSRMSYSRVW
jgi:hypothetical protein